MMTLIKEMIHKLVTPALARCLSCGTLLLMLWSLPSPIGAQENSVSKDTLAFRQYLSDNFGTRINVRYVAALYQRLTHDYTKAEKEQVKTIIPSMPNETGYSKMYLQSGTMDDYVHVEVGAGDQMSTTSGQSWFMDNAKFPESLRIFLRSEVTRYDRRPGLKKEDKEALIRNLAAFDSVSTNKPIFFSEIYGKFKGDYRKYVNHLYKKSILTSNSRMMYFTRRPTAKKLQSDPGVQFVIGLALYDSWIKDVREGRVKDGL